MSDFLVECEYVHVPVSFIEEHLKDANAAYVKIYLYILNLATKRKSMTYAEIATELKLIESDIINAVEYWKNAGVFKESGENIIISNGKSINKEITEEKREEKKENKKPSYDSIKVAGDIAEDASLSDMMALAQDIFGRILTTAEMESVFWFYDRLGFSHEAILLLLEYCVSKGKTSMKYIERVAVAWSEKGATSADKVCEIIKEDEQRTSYLYSLRKLLGIADRALSQNEEKYLMKWRNERQMSEEMVALAYEYCIIQTAKLSFPYMDKIIERWYKQGIHDVLAAEEDNKNFKERKTTETTTSNDNGYTDLENLTRGRFDK